MSPKEIHASRKIRRTLASLRLTSRVFPVEKTVKEQVKTRRSPLQPISAALRIVLSFSAFCSELLGAVDTRLTFIRTGELPSIQVVNLRLIKKAPATANARYTGPIKCGDGGSRIQ